MRLVFLCFLFLFSSNPLTAQQPAEWARVYSFDDSIIEMNTSLVTFISRDIIRVRFRWTFDEPVPLIGEPKGTYQSRLEVTEFDCAKQQYRPYHLTFFDAAGNMVRVEEMGPVGEWRSATSGIMSEKLFAPACELIKQKTRTPIVSDDEIKLERVAKYALSFSQHLEQTKDFKPIIEKFFAASYLDGYLRDQTTNRFLNLNRATAARLSRRELQRFYVALLNTGYLASLYAISQHPADSDEPVSVEKLIPVDIAQLIRNHPYTAAYKPKEGNYDYLAENIDSLARLRSYTDLLEGIGKLMRQHVLDVAAIHSKEYRAMLENWDWTFNLYKPRVRNCAGNCLGLPKGTRLFEVNVPVFRLQLAEIKGNLRIVSATTIFQ